MQLGLDSFIRSNSSGTWGTATDGQTWSVQSGSATQNLTSNEGIATAVTALTYIQLGATTSADAEAIVRVSVSSTNYTAVGLCLRATGTTTFYRLRLNSNASSQGVGIVKTVSGTSTNLVTGSFTVSINTFYWLRGRVEGTNLYVKAWADGSAEPAAWSLQTSDSSITGAGKFGLCVNTSTSGDTAKFDSFYAFDYIFADTNTLSESSAYTVSESNTDSGTVAETGIPTTIFIPSDVLTTSETDTFVVTSSTTDSGTLNETNLATIANSVTDALTLSEVSTYTDIFAPTETLTGQESALYKPSFAGADSSIVSELNSVTVNGQKTDALTASELAAYALALSVAESGILSDTLSYFPFYLATLIDTNLTTSDIFAATVNFLPVDSLSEIETLVAAISLAVSEAGVLGEVLLGNTINTAIDQATNSENSAYRTGYVPTETLTGQENAQYIISGATSDALTGQEAFSGAIMYTAVELMSASEILLAIPALSFIDSVTLADLFSANNNFVPIDANNIIDVLSLSISFAATDSSSLSDTLSYLLTTLVALSDVALQAVEVLLATEAYQALDWLLSSDGILGNPNAQPVDQLSTSEIATYSVQGSPVDTATTTDLLFALCSISLSEILSTSDSLDGMPIFSATDTLTALENINLTLASFGQDALLLTELGAFLGIVQSVDTLSAGESIAAGLWLYWNEQMTASEQVNPLVQYSTQDTGSVSEAGAWQGALQASDQVATSEVALFASVAALVDVVTISETISVALALQLSDALVAIETLLATLTYMIVLQGQDSFARVDQSGFGTASDGQIWTILGPGTVIISANEGVIVSPSNDTNAYLGTKKFLGDMEVTCKIAINNINDVCGIQARFASGAQIATYKFLFYGNSININKDFNNAITNLATQPFTITLDTYFWYKLRAQGNTLTAKIWQSGVVEPGNWMLSTTDSAISIGGFGLVANTDPASTGVRFDSFTATTYSLPDSLTSAETVLWQPTSSTIDSLVNVEQFAITVLQQSIDVLTVGEQLLVVPAVSIADVLIANENAQYVAIFLPADQAHQSEQWQAALSYGAVDVVTVRDFGPDIGVALIDTALFPADSLSFSVYEFMLVMARIRSGQVQGVIRTGQMRGIVRSGLMKGKIL